MVVPDRIVQHQRVIPVPPVVADAIVLFDDERRDVELLEPRRDGESRLSAPNDQHLRVCFGKGILVATLVEPVPAPDLFSVRDASNPSCAQVLLESLQLLHRGQESPRFPTPLAVRHEAEEAATSRQLRLEPVEGLDGARGIGSREGGLSAGLESKFTRPGGCHRPRHRATNRLRAVERPQVPREREQVAPPAFRHEEIGGPCHVLLLERLAEPAEPRTGNRGGRFDCDR